MSGLPPAAYAGALACLPGIGPATLHRMLADGEPAEVWRSVRSGALRRPPARAGGDGHGRKVTWAEAAARVPLAEWWDRWARQGIGVTWPGDRSYPERLRRDPEPPGVLFWRGCLDRLAEPCVAVVGTRRCSPDGRASGYELGRDLASAGVCVISGLALGIDGAAHLGALEADPALPGRTVGVAASGVDVAYPARHAVLWERVAGAGAIVSETPPGHPAQAWRFPSRNRIIAGLADLVVIVESHRSGGSLITAEKAIDRGIEVRVVPGPVHAPFAAGSNQLLYDGPGPVRDACDVLDALGMVALRPRRSGKRRQQPAGRADRLPPPRPVTATADATRPDPQRAVLDALGGRPASLNRIVERSGLAVAAVMQALGELQEAGLVVEEGGWFTRRAPRGGA